MTAYSKRVVFTMGGKGGVGKTGVVVALAEWFEANEIPVTLLDLDTENKARGSLKHFFDGTVTKVNIHTPAGLAIGTVKHLGEDEHNQLLVELMSGESVTTSAIEGEVLNRARVQSSILHQLGLASPDKRRVLPAEQGIAEMMVDLYRSFSMPLSDEMLLGWHRMVTSGRKRPRRYWKIPHQPRTNADHFRSNRCFNSAY